MINFERLHAYPFFNKVQLSYIDYKHVEDKSTMLYKVHVIIYICLHLMKNYIIIDDDTILQKTIRR